MKFGTQRDRVVFYCLYRVLDKPRRETSHCLYHVLDSLRRGPSHCLYRVLDSLRRGPSHCLYRVLDNPGRGTSHCLYHVLDTQGGKPIRLVAISTPPKTAVLFHLHVWKLEIFYKKKILRIIFQRSFSLFE